MATVPRRLRRPLVASFWIGGRVGFSTMVCGVAAALDHEAIDDAVKNGPAIEAFVA